MPIQEISLGVVANDGEGDPLREGGERINQNFTNPLNAASYEVGADAGQVPRNDDLGTAAQANTGLASGQVPTADDLGVVGETNYHSGNINVNEFGGSAGKDIGRGTAFSSTSAIFYLPINGVSNPTSITVTGSFSVLSTAGLITSGITSLSLGGTSSSRLAVITATVSGATINDSLGLRTETDSSKIVVNF